MPKLISCPHCGSQISSSAERCPKCNKETVAKSGKLAPCRVCGHMLPVEKYYSKEYSRYISNGNTEVSTFYMHYACPNCGEKKPLLAIEKSRKGNLLLVSILFAVASLFVARGAFATMDVSTDVGVEAVAWIVFAVSALCVLFNVFSLFRSD